MGLIYTAAAVGSAYRKVLCEECGKKYAFLITRLGWGEGSSVHARGEAEDRVREQLASEVVCVPCPHCGAFQDDMIEVMRHRATRGRFVLALALALCALPAVFVALIATGAVFVSGDTRTKTYAMFAGGWAVTAFLLLASAGTFVLWRSARRSFNPYQGRPPKVWKARARKRGAITMEELAIIEVEQRELEAERRAKPGPVLGGATELPEAAEPPVAKPWDSKQKSTSFNPPPAAPPSDKNPFDFG